MNTILYAHIYRYKYYIPFNGCLQVFLERRNAHLVQSAKSRNTYSDHSISCSGFRVKIHGNLCYHYKSFVGRDYKACMVSDGSVYNKSVHWRGRTESVTGFVKSKYTMYSK